MSVDSVARSAPSPSIGTPAETIVDPPRYGRWVTLTAIAVFLVWIAFQLVTNPGFQWPTVFRYLFAPAVLYGVATTVQLTILIMVIGIAIGIIVALLKMSRDPLLQFCGNGYVWFFRGTPVLVQLIFWYNLAAIFPQISFGVPFGGPKFFEVSATVAISSFTAALLAFGLNQGAYMAEIIRAGLLSVENGQTEASKALGHKPAQTFRVIVLPQAMKAIVPPTGNQFIGMLKYTSIASVVAMHELMHSVESIYNRTFETIPLLIVAAIWYLTMVSILTVLQYFLERHYLKGWEADVHPSAQT